MHVGMRSFAERDHCDRLRPKTERGACATGGVSCLLALGGSGAWRAGKGWGAPTPDADTCALLRHRTAAVGGGRIGRVAGHGREQIVIVPVAFAF